VGGLSGKSQKKKGITNVEKKVQSDAPRNHLIKGNTREHRRRKHANKGKTKEKSLKKKIHKKILEENQGESKKKLCVVKKTSRRENLQNTDQKIRKRDLIGARKKSPAREAEAAS